MEAKGRIANYVVKYYCDPTMDYDENHISDILFLTDIDEKHFDELSEAIHFLTECVCPITCVEQLIPELKNACAYKYILPERNIRPKHVLSNKVDEFTDFETENRWG